jgi:hypothetical protein
MTTSAQSRGENEWQLPTHCGPSTTPAVFNGRATILGDNERMDEDQLFVDVPPYRPRPVTEMVPANPIAERLARLPTRLDGWRAALLGTPIPMPCLKSWLCFEKTPL